LRYEVEETRVGQKTNYDKLTMEIWTDGTVTPEMALVEAAKILRKHLNPFVAYGKPGAAVSAVGIRQCLLCGGGAAGEPAQHACASDLKTFACGPANCLEAERHRHAS
jgi:DNA-directed RNA polymerase subunit alpha